MEKYNLLPFGGDWWENPECVGCCGCLWPYITSKTRAIAYAKSVKKRFPNVEFELTKSNSWGSAEVIATF